MHHFSCLSVTPLALAHPGLAVATIRAGGVGILDREFCTEADLAQAKSNLQMLLQERGKAGGLGLRLRCDQIAASTDLLELLAQVPHWLILSGWDATTLPEALAALPEHPERTLLMEVIAVGQVSVLDAVPCAGLVARGHESGGWVAEDPAFILTQKLLASQSRPVYVQGGIGIHTAAACRMAGAAGIVLDDQLWLMPESPLPASWQRHLKNLSGQEAIVLAERLTPSCRVLARPGFHAIAALQKLADHGELADASGWQQSAQPLLGWGEPSDLAWPMGQAVGLADPLHERFKTTGRLIQALLQASAEHIQTAQRLQPLQPGAPLAQAHSTRYPIVQGPMTRVSDTAEFAHAVACAGALPLLALALLRGVQVESLLRKTRDLMQGAAWGVGILGFVPHALREEQTKIVQAIKPPFALIAGGRPDQAKQFEAEGIAAYIHVPTASLLKLFLEQGARRFVFEGRECGGHVGPLSSFLLWESMIETLLHLPAGIEPQAIHVLFAGGVHDARSAAMVSAMAAPLAERGIKFGVLMGTAYLFTEEAVACGAIVKGFQEEALQCTRTINLETGPGHASRCAVTAFAHEFYATRRRMALSGSPAEDIKNTLEDLTLGRLRIASKGLTRDAEGKIIQVLEERQHRDGMYMIGQVATMRDRVCTVEYLHQEVSEASTRLVCEAEGGGEVVPPSRPSDIAIVGLSTLVPKAHRPEDYWKNILERVNAITEIPAHRWDWRLFYDEDRKARDRIYSKWGGFIEDVTFDPLRFGIPPASLKSIDPIQLLALDAVQRALADAGYDRGDFDREHTSVIFGAATGAGDLGHQYATRSHLPLFVSDPATQAFDRLPEWTEESFPGLLLNVAAGRVANRFDLGGTNYTVDAACASSLAALNLAIEELETGRSNIVIAGGVDTGQSPFAYLTFCKTQALSPRQQPKAFDKTTDGIVISEGIAVVILKRLADAERDGDHIYAVVKSMAGSSDGKAMGLTAPRPSGQIRALDRAYRKAGFSPNTLGLYEAHGTGTAAGDRAELETIVKTLKTHRTRNKSCVVGSVKTMIGHTKSCAGVVGLVKAALALYHKVLPPHMGVEKPLDPLADPESPVYLLQEARPWFRHPDYPRRGGVSAFGFGGTNFHAVLEEYQGSLKEPVLGAKAWPQELCVLRAADRAALIQEIQTLHTALVKGAQPALGDLAFSLAERAQERWDQNACLCIIARDLTHLGACLEQALTHLEGAADPLPLHILFSEKAALHNRHVAFLFPGQGSQYPDMAREQALYLHELRAAVEGADRQLQETFPDLLSQYIYPPSPFSPSDEARHQARLMDTRIAQPALGTIMVGYLDFLARLGIDPSMLAGHSYGEYVALYGAGALGRAEFLALSATRGRVMATACAAQGGAMAAVQGDRAQVLEYLQGMPGVTLANHNSPQQSVISGTREAVQTVVDRLKAQGVQAKLLAVTGAFHTALVAEAQGPLAEAIAQSALTTPQIPVYANADARPYPLDEEAVRRQLSQHLTSPVEFVGQVRAMHADGARVFLEVGPKSVLTKLVGQILVGQEHIAVALDGHGGGLRGLLLALGTLITQGVGLKLTALFEGRTHRSLDLKRLLEQTCPAPLPPVAWLVNGGNVRPYSQSVGHPGKLPPLDVTTAQTEAHAQRNGSSPSVAPVALPAANQTQPPLPVVAATVRPVARAPHKSSTPPNLAMASQTPQPAHPAPVSPPSHVALAGYQAYQETMRQFLSLQERVMVQFLSGVQPAPGALPQPAAPIALPAARPSAALPVAPAPPSRPAPVVVTAPAPPTPAPVPPVAAAAALPARAQLTQTLLHLVSERTGYPAEMLGLDQDMEAELGIDSIKRVEIFGALQKNLPTALASRVQDEMESFTQVKTLGGIVDALLSSAPATPAAVAGGAGLGK
ncbi:type I polyketide synthase [Anthocerotibacter panamensis]|uniref:type I polyketide synthase n=1 Tax=Anthocerotibacter panamensis TaxID=2857077 RepID=UPI001C40365E|nr:type I polyketide synthase [Anthocerotibacter panamensis]